MQRTQMCHTNRRFQHRNRTRSLNQENGPLFELIKTTLTIIQNLQVKKEQGFIGQHSMGTNRRQQTRTSSHLSVDKWKVSNDLIPNYRIFSVQTFKNILCQAIPHYRQQLEQYLNDSRLLSFIQQYTHLFCIFYQLELEKDYWKNINDKLLFAMNWLRKMSKDLTKRYLLDWNYPRTEKNLRHRQRSLENKIASTTRELQIHLQQYAPFYIEWNPALMQQTLPIILQATMTLIKIDLQRFETNFVHRKLLMQYDANNVELLKSFYDAHPSEQDVNYHSYRYVLINSNVFFVLEAYFSKTLVYAT